MVGARWNRRDPIGRIMEQDGENPRYRFHAVPALNDSDKSNFDFSPSKVGFTTDYYLSERNKQDPVDWAAKFQQRPYDVQGQLYPDEELRFFTELPDSREWRVMYVADIAWGCVDFYSGVMLYISGENEEMEVYLEDVTFNKFPKERTIPQTAQLIQRHNPYACYWEAKQDGTASYPEAVEKELQKIGVHTSINKMTGKSPTGTSNKLARLIQWSGDVKKFYFRKHGFRSAEYNAFMNNLREISVEGKAKNDDSADALSLACQIIYKPQQKAVAKVGNRLF
jgi:hypothetical protein